MMNSLNSLTHASSLLDDGHRPSGSRNVPSASARAAAMDVAITGASGLIGSALARSLAADGHQVRAGRTGPGGGRLRHLGSRARATIDAAGLEGVDAVVHLAGEGVAVGPLDRRAAAQDQGEPHQGHHAAGRDAGRPRPPADGARDRLGHRVLRRPRRRGADRAEHAGRRLPGPGLRRVGGRRPAAAARPASGSRTPAPASCSTTEGGAFPKLAAAVQARASAGRRRRPGVVVVDHARGRGAGHPLPHRPRRAGPVNLTAPNPVRSVEFAKTLGRVLHRPAVLPVPRFLTKAARSASATWSESLLFTSAARRPTVLTSAGFTFAPPPPGGRGPRPCWGRTAALSPSYFGGIRMPPSTRITSAFM